MTKLKAGWMRDLAARWQGGSCFMAGVGVQVDGRGRRLCMDDGLGEPAFAELLDILMKEGVEFGFFDSRIRRHPTPAPT